MTDSIPSVIFVCGQSGAGRNTALKVLEDCGYHPIDNLPPKMLMRLLSEDIGQEHIAFGFTFLNLEDVQTLIEVTDELRKTIKVELLFLEARDSVLVRRFSETRRRHPFTHGRPLQDAIAEEIELLAPLEARADTVIDTSNLTPHDLKDQLKKALNLEAEHPFLVQVMSFSYKRGVPVNADFVWDCRFLRNPHWNETLRPNDGRDQAVVDYIFEDKDAAKYAEDIERILGYTLPRVQQEGRSYVTIAFGCSGGRHRSVAFAEKTYKVLTEAGFHTILSHREIS